MQIVDESLSRKLVLVYVMFYNIGGYAYNNCVLTGAALKCNVKFYHSDGNMFLLVLLTHDLKALYNFQGRSIPYEDFLTYATICRNRRSDYGFKRSIYWQGTYFPCYFSLP